MPNTNFFFVITDFNLMTKYPERSERLKAFFNQLNLKNKDIASKLGIKPAFISQLINKHATVTAAVAMRINVLYPILNVKWLLYGEGEMFLEKKEPEPGILTGVLEPEVEYVTRRITLDELPGIIAGMQSEIGVLRDRVLALEDEVAALRGGCVESKE